MQAQRLLEAKLQEVAEREAAMEEAPQGRAQETRARARAAGRRVPGRADVRRGGGRSWCGESRWRCRATKDDRTTTRATQEGPKPSRRGDVGWRQRRGGLGRCWCRGAGAAGGGRSSARDTFATTTSGRSTTSSSRSARASARRRDRPKPRRVDRPQALQGLTEEDEYDHDGGLEMSDAKGARQSDAKRHARERSQAASSARLQHTAAEKAEQRFRGTVG